MDECVDYRNTKYCPQLVGIKERKQDVELLIKKEHPNAKDMHNYISPNKDSYKLEFFRAYNGKCAYCGVSYELLPMSSFEIDHFLYEKASCFATKKDAGYIENLVLSCHSCNHNKSAFWVEEEDFDNLHPDGTNIKDTFIRDDRYYIRVNDKYTNNQSIVKFYHQLKLGSELHRLDFLIMNVIGLQRKYEDNEQLYTGLGKIKGILNGKRNLVG